MPLVSVVIPAFNLASYIGETLRSVQAQTLEDFEAIMVDDASSDGTAEIMASFAANDPRFRLIRFASNRGVVAARNAALEVATGEFVAMQDGDDLWTPDALDERLGLARRFPEADMVVTDFAWFEDAVPEPPYVGRVRLGPRGSAAFGECCASGEPIFLSKPFEAVATMHFAWIGAILAKRSAVAAVGNFETGFVGPEDTLLWLRLARRGPFVFDPRVTAFYRQRPNSASTRYERPKERMYLRVLYRLLDDPLTSDERAIVTSVIAESHHISSVYFRKTKGGGHEGVDHAWQALRRDPVRFAYWRNLAASLVDRVVGLARPKTPPD